MKKIDMHIHVAPEAIYKKDRLFISDPRQMLSHMDDLGIEKAVLMSGGETPDALGSNDANAQICAQYPDRFAWMCNVDCREPETVYDRLSRCKDQGAVGIGELMQNLPLDDPFLQAVFSAAQRLQMPVTFHMSPEPGFNYGVVDHPGLPLLEQTLRTYPDVRFLGHSQVFWIEISGDAPTDPKGRNAWGKGPVRPGGVLPRLFDCYSNLYGDLSANSACRAIMRDEAFGAAFLEKYADRMFFATDMLNADTTFPLADWMQSHLSCEVCEKIFYRNAHREFGL